MSVRAPIPELLKFLGAYDEKIVRLALAVRRVVLGEAPKASESIYDAYSAVAIGYSFTGRLKESFCHVAVYSAHVNLGFNRGVDLPDPKKLLQGSGSQIRHLTIRSAADLKQPHVRRFLRTAIMNAKALALANDIPTIPPQSVVKWIYAKKRRPGM
jgi:hypothetical protein